MTTALSSTIKCLKPTSPSFIFAPMIQNAFLCSQSVLNSHVSMFHSLNLFSTILTSGSFPLFGSKNERTATKRFWNVSFCCSLCLDFTILHLRVSFSESVCSCFYCPLNFRKKFDF